MTGHANSWQSAAARRARRRRWPGRRIDEQSGSKLPPSWTLNSVTRVSCRWASDHRPLPQRQRLVGEHQRQAAVAGRGGAHQGHLDLAGQALDGGDRDVAGQRQVVARAACRAAWCSSGRLVVCLSWLSWKMNRPCAGDQQQRRRRVVLEAHAARPVEPGGALGDAAVGRDLQEARLQRVQTVQIGLDAGDVGVVLRRSGGAAAGAAGSGASEAARASRVRRFMRADVARARRRIKAAAGMGLFRRRRVGRSASAHNSGASSSRPVGEEQRAGER